MLSSPVSFMLSKYSYFVISTPEGEISQGRRAPECASGILT